MTSTSQREPEVWRGGAALTGLHRCRREAGWRSVVLVVDAAVAASGYGAVDTAKQVAIVLGGSARIGHR